METSCRPLKSCASIREPLKSMSNSVRKLEHPGSARSHPKRTLRQRCAARSRAPRGSVRTGRLRAIPGNRGPACKTAPEGQGRAAGSPLISEDADIVEATIDARSDSSTTPRCQSKAHRGRQDLCVSSHAILALIRRGKRVCG